MAERVRIGSGVPFESQLGYSRAVRVGDRVFVSGTTAIKDGQAVGVGDAGAQTRQILDTILRALDQLGATANDIVRYRIYLTNIADWPAVTAEIAKVFGPTRPAATLVQISGLIDPDTVVEIEVDAVVGSTDGSPIPA